MRKEDEDVLCCTNHRVLARDPIHRVSPNESITIPPPTRRSLVVSPRSSAWWLAVIGVTRPSVLHNKARVSLLATRLEINPVYHLRLYPQCATVIDSQSAEKKGVSGMSSECMRATDAVAPQSLASGSLAISMSPFCNR